MPVNKCACGRSTDFGNLCVWCTKDKILDKVDDFKKDDDTSYGEPVEEVYEDPE